MRMLSKEKTEKIKNFLLSLAREDGGYLPSQEPGYKGIADSKVSDLAAAVYVSEIAQTIGFEVKFPEKTVEFIKTHQSPEGFFHSGTGFSEEIQEAHQIYNTCMGVRGLKVFNQSPDYDPRPYLNDYVRKEFAELPDDRFSPYHPDMVINTYAAIEEQMPADMEELFSEKLLKRQDPETGWLIQNPERPFANSNPMTFHAVRFFHLAGKKIPMADKILETFMKMQEEDGSWKGGNVHGTFDASVSVRILSDNSKQYLRMVQRTVPWVLTCLQKDGGFNHFGETKPPHTNQPDESWTKKHPETEPLPSEVDACYFHIATLVMAGAIKTKLTRENRWIGWGHTLINNSSVTK